MLNDEQYIHRILNSGTESAVFALVKKYECQVFNLCFRVLRDREVAEEVAQDIFLKALKELDKLEDHSKFGGWLMRIAYRKSIDQVRKKKVQFVNLEDEKTRHLESDISQLASAGVESEDRIDLLEKELKQIPEMDSALISLYYLDGFSVKEVAEVMGLTESNVKVRLMRTRELLKRNLTQKLGNETKDLY